MITARSLAIAMLSVLFSGQFIDAQDLSVYREFQFGMSLPAVTKQVGLEPSAAKVIHQRPALIQEVNWRPPFSLSFSPQADAVGNTLFRFYNGELFRIVVHYDRYKTQGLTSEDLIEAISSEYGTATKPDADKAAASSPIHFDSEVDIARWEDPHYSLTLFYSSYQSTFKLVILSKRLDALAQVAISEAIFLDKQEAPQLEVERQKKQAEENRASQEKARLTNKAKFRP